jgi:hypothetical protein
MNFSKASAVSAVIEQMKTAEIPRANNRSLMDCLYNGNPPYSAKEVEDNQIDINVNFKEGTVLLHRARQQFENALLKPGNYFNVHLNDAPPEKADEWGRTITRLINRALKRGPKSKSYMQVLRSQIAGLVVHGVGCKFWDNRGGWLPKFVGMQDLLIPTDTDLDYQNLVFFAVRREMRPGELLKKISGKKVARGWNKSVIYKILEGVKDDQQNTDGYTWTNNPEKMTELWKQNASYYNSDAVATVKMWDFYYGEETDQGEQEGWRRCIVLDNNSNSGSSSANTKDGEEAFIYKSPDIYARELSEFIQFQFGDGNVIPPFKYHSIRSLGYLLYDVVQLSNRMNCRMTEHFFEQTMMLFRLADPAGNSAPTKVTLLNKGFIENGVSIVPNAERNQIDPRYAELSAQKMKQFMVESAASYTQNDAQGGGEKTATQVITEQNQVNVLVATMLNLAYTQEEVAQKEICRRFCIKGSKDKDVVEFQKKAKKAGIPEQWLNVDYWDVEAVRVLGAGNKTIELAQARELLAMIQLLDPEAQQTVKRMFVGALTDNDSLARTLVKENPVKVTDATHDAELAFGSLMQGVPVKPKPGLSPREQIETVLRLMTMKVQFIEQTGGLGTPQDVIGLQAAANYVGQLMKQLEQDKAEKQRVKQYGDVLGKLMNMVKAFAQRQQEQQQKSQMDPAKMMELRATQTEAQLRSQISQQEAQQRLQQQQQAFAADQQRKDAETKAKIARDDALARAEIQRISATTQADVAQQVATGRVKIADARARTESDIQNSKLKAESAADTKKPVE